MFRSGSTYSFIFIYLRYTADLVKDPSKWGITANCVMWTAICKEEKFRVWTKLERKFTQNGNAQSADTNTIQSIEPTLVIDDAVSWLHLVIVGR